MAKTTQANAPTPDTTPPPGGGRYRWSDTAPYWIEIDENGNPVNAALPAAPITAPTTEGV